ncbi:MAG: class I SAM-dependent methyltransferase [Sediminibacterium sp.]|nr:class I SAM-dependent methyltransferase [Sediminibacterium sp.]
MSDERQSDTTDNPWWGEHLHRYEEAGRLLGSASLTVLDLACGTGFGSDYLARLGHIVTGGDISEASIAECQQKYQRDKLTFMVMDACVLPFPNGVFDAVVSFETIEHTTRYHEVLNEFKRVLKPGGSIILSTPNFPVNSPKGFIENPYHTQEWNFQEFKDLLNQHFSSQRISGQKYARYDRGGGFRYSLARYAEFILYRRGARKLPLKWQNAIIRGLIRKPMYPLSSDYVMVEREDEIKKCKTFFAICKP